ncbi:MAG: hypothetical protein WBE83_10495 [Candidatus Cybelea sp.]|jgi:hypothetical protein
MDLSYSVGTEIDRFSDRSFTGGRDGSLPLAGLIDMNGALYGTTVSGGGTSCVDQFWFDDHGCGTIYKLTTSGDERVRFRFESEYVGEPAASLVNVDSVLLGTTPQSNPALVPLVSRRAQLALFGAFAHAARVRFIAAKVSRVVSRCDRSGAAATGSFELRG